MRRITRFFSAQHAHTLVLLLLSLAHSPMDKLGSSSSSFSEPARQQQQQQWEAHAKKSTHTLVSRNPCLFCFSKKISCSSCGCCSHLYLQTAEGEENEFKGCLEVSDMRRKEMDGSLKPEPLLIENPGRFVLFPIQDNEVRQTRERRKSKQSKPTRSPPKEVVCMIHSCAMACIVVRIPSRRGGSDVPVEG